MVVTHILFAAISLVCWLFLGLLASEMSSNSPASTGVDIELATLLGVSLAWISTVIISDLLTNGRKWLISIAILAMVLVGINIVLPGIWVVCLPTICVSLGFGARNMWRSR